MMSGYAGTLGRKVTGCVRRILPGICFEVAVGKGTALLWRKYSLESDDAKEQGRPDHPNEYRDMRAVVDCDFWMAQGVDPLFLATESDCFPGTLPPSPTDLQEQLEIVRDLAESRGPNSLTAWNRQIGRVKALIVRPPPSPTLKTPPRPQRSEPDCPPAPTKRPLPQSDSDKEEDQKEEDSDFEDDAPEEEEEDFDSEEDDQDNEDQDNEDDDTYIPRRTLTNAINITEFVSAIEEFIYTEHVVIVSNKTIIALIMIFLSMFALVLLAKVK